MNYLICFLFSLIFVANLNSQTADEFLSKAQTSYFLEKFDEADDYIEKAIKLDNKNSLIFYYKALVLIKKSDTTNAISNLNMAIKLDPNYHEAYLKRGILLYYNNKNSIAFTDFEKSISLNPNHHEAFFYKGLVLYNTKSFKKALASFDSCIAKNSSFSDAYYYKGLVYKSMKEYDLSIECLNKAIRENNQDTLYYASRADIYKIKNDTNLYENDMENLRALKEEIANQLNSQGIQLKNKGKNKEAAELYNKAIAIYPSLCHPYNNLAIIKEDEANYNKALEYYDIAISINPSYALAYDNKGVLLNKLKRFREAIVCLDSALKYDKQNANYYVERSYSKLNINDYLGTIDDCKKALALNPNHEIACNNMGYAYSMLGDEENALKYYNLSLKIKPDYDLAIANKNNLLFKRGNKTVTLEMINQKIISDSTDAYLYQVRGEYKFDQSDYEGAIEDYLKCLKLDSNNIRVYQSIAVAYINLSKNDEVLLYLNKAINLKPNNIEALSLRGFFYETIQKLDKALEDYIKVLEIAPQRVQIKIQIAFVYLQKGDYKKACEEIKDVTINNRLVEEIRRYCK